MTGIDPAMFELFREEVRSHTDTLTAGLLELEADPANPQRLEPLMRAAHSLKGAARIVGIDPAVRLAHVMEDALVAAQEGRVRVTAADIDALLRGADILAGLAGLEQDTIAGWTEANEATIARLEPVFEAIALGTGPTAVPIPVTPEPAGPPPPVAPAVPPPAAVHAESAEPVVPREPLPLPADHTMFDLFREEVRGHLVALLDGLRDVSAGSPPDAAVEAMRQLKGAARLTKCPPVEAAAGTIGAFLTAVRDGRAEPTPKAVGLVRQAVEQMAGVIATDEESFPGWITSAAGPIEQTAAALRKAPESAPKPGPVRAPATVAQTHRPATEPAARPAREAEPSTPSAPRPGPSADPVVRVTAQSLNRLMGLAGESLVQARWLHLFSSSLLKLKKQHDILAGLLDGVFQAAAAGESVERVAHLVADARRQAVTCRDDLADQSGEFDDHAGRAEDLNSRLYREVIASRMRPFADGAHGFARMVRDMARSLGKQARLVVEGENTEVDRDVLEKLEAPLAHLIRNAVDHAIEPAAERVAAGKPEVGSVRVEARHRAGMLSLTVSDDGRGIDLDRLRRKIVERGLNSDELVRQMTEQELLEFLFLPGFSTASGVTEFSGRGVGLDVVQDTVRRIGGSVRVTTTLGRGTTFNLQLPITLSVIRAVVVDIGGEPYAFPHNRIDRLLRVPRDEVRSLEHRQFVTVDGQNVGLVMAGQLLDVPADAPRNADMAVVLLSDQSGTYGLVVDAIRGEQDLVVRPLDARLGKVQNLSAAAVLDDGEPVLIVDVEDLVRSMDTFIQTGSLRRCEVRDTAQSRKKRVLVVDDSITVREVERQLLLHQGYDVAVAVDGVDGWNQLRGGRFDLVVTDVDMPRMTGLQLVQAVRADDRLKDLPVVIVSYKEREEDRIRGLEVGANYYLTKSSFHDNRFVQAVADLIGEARVG